MTGAPLSSFVVVKAADLVLTQGQELLKSYTVTSRTQRHFCTDCGTPLYNSNQETYAGLTMQYLGTVNQHEGLAPGMDIFCDNKLLWLTISEAAGILSKHRASPKIKKASPVFTGTPLYCCR